MADFTPEELKQFLISRTTDTWKNEARPYYLAMAQPELSSKGKDYRVAVGDKSLSQFSSEVDGIKIVRHPTQHARIGLVPSGVDYQFDAPEPIESPKPPQSTSKRKIDNSERIVFDFLRLLSKHEDRDLEEFHIPAKIIAKMIRD